MEGPVDAQEVAALMALADRLEVVKTTSTDVGVRRLLKFFAFAHLPMHLGRISSHFALLAIEVAALEATDPAERTVSLRKLLEAKDAAVRAML